jgi:hypothetical protein
MINIHEIKLSDHSIYQLDCPNCFVRFDSAKKDIKSALLHKQKHIFCCVKCSREFRRVDKNILSKRILSFYFDSGKIPSHKDFKFASIYRRYFGSWSRALEYCGLDLVKEKSHIENANTWTRQKERHNRIKREFVELKGGKCELCGYNRNFAALQFHHIDPKEKSIPLDARSMGNISEERLRDEIKKCQLLCANCHIEHHNPNFNRLCSGLKEN